MYAQIECQQLYIIFPFIFLDQEKKQRTKHRVFMQMHSQNHSKSICMNLHCLYACLICCFFLSLSHSLWPKHSPTCCVCLYVVHRLLSVFCCLVDGLTSLVLLGVFHAFSYAKFIYSERTLLTVSNPLLNLNCVVRFGVAQFDSVLISRNVFIVS